MYLFNFFFKKTGLSRQQELRALGKKMKWSDIRWGKKMEKGRKKGKGQFFLDASIAQMDV